VHCIWVSQDSTALILGTPVAAACVAPEKALPLGGGWWVASELDVIAGPRPRPHVIKRLTAAAAAAAALQRLVRVKMAA
jgi:hypothetical protein